MTLNVMPSFLKPLILTVAMLSSVATAHAISTSEAQSIWPYDEKVIAVRTESAVTADANTERMTAEFLIKQKRNACFAYPVLLKRPTGATAWPSLCAPRRWRAGPGCRWMRLLPLVC